MLGRWNLGFPILLLLVPTSTAEGFSVPRSNTVVEGELRVGPGEHLEYGIRDGVTMTIEEGENKYGMIPVLREDLQGATFLLFRISVGQNGEEKVAYDGSKQVPLHGSQSVSGKFDISIKSFRGEKFSTKPMAPADSAAEDPNALKKVYGNENCCIRCNGLQVCASLVKMTCGNCSKYSE